MANELTEFLARLNVPQPCRVISTGGGQDTSVGAELRRRDLGGMAGEDGQLGQINHGKFLQPRRRHGFVHDHAHGNVRLHERFVRWHDETVDLPGTYYLQVVHWIYRENRIANGTFMALGRTVRWMLLRLGGWTTEGRAMFPV